MTSTGSPRTGTYICLGDRLRPICACDSLFSYAVVCLATFDCQSVLSGSSTYLSHLSSSLQAIQIACNSQDPQFMTSNLLHASEMAGTSTLSENSSTDT